MFTGVSILSLFELVVWILEIPLALRCGVFCLRII